MQRCCTKSNIAVQTFKSKIVTIPEELAEAQITRCSQTCTADLEHRQVSISATVLWAPAVTLYGQIEAGKVYFCDITVCMILSFQHQ